MEGRESDDQLVLYGRTLTSRLLLGTARYDSPSILAEAICAADPAVMCARHDCDNGKEKAAI